VIFAWMNARVDVDIESEGEKKRGMKKRRIARYFFTVFKPRENSGLALLSISFSLFLSASLSLSLIYPASPLLKRQKFLIELLFFAGDFLELQKGKNEKKKKRKTIFPQKTFHPTDIYPDLVP
jgi:hypothetical protein